MLNILAVIDKKDPSTEVLNVVMIVAIIIIIALLANTIFIKKK